MNNQESIYFKLTVEQPGARIIQYIEFADGWANRQVEEYPDENEWFFCGNDSSVKDKLRMCDQPLSRIKLKDKYLIDRSEVERAWESANNWKIANTLSKV